MYSCANFNARRNRRSTAHTQGSRTQVPSSRRDCTNYRKAAVKRGLECEAALTPTLPALKSIQLVSAADKLHSARAILRHYREAGEALSRFTGGRDGTPW